MNFIPLMEDWYIICHLAAFCLLIVTKHLTQGGTVHLSNPCQFVDNNCLVEVKKKAEATELAAKAVNSEL